MYKSYLVVAFRNLFRHRLYSFINVFGLAVGLSACVLVLLFIKDEFKNVNFHKKANRIFRVLRESDGQFTSRTSGGITPALQSEFPDIEQSIRVLPWPFWVRYEDKILFQRFYLADAAILGMFDYKLLVGDPQTVLSEPMTAIVSESAAIRFFGDADPLGKIVTVDSDKMGGDYKITGILRDISPDAYFSFDFLTSFPPPDVPNYFRVRAWEGFNPNDSWRPFKNFVLLPEGLSSKDLEAKLPDFMSRHMGEKVASRDAFHLQPLNRIHLYSKVDYGIQGGSDIKFIYTLSILALFVLVIACINFMNLSTARSASRAREIGLRKVVGAIRFQLIRQFLGESVLLALFAFFISLLLVELSLPVFNQLLGKNLALSIEQNTIPMIGFGILSLFVGLLAGIYPSVFLASFAPAEALKGSLRTGTRHAGLRKGLVVFKFTISAVLIVSTTVVYRQTEFLKHKDLGYNQEQIVIIPIFFAMYDRVPRRYRYMPVKQAFSQHPNVVSISATYPYPGGPSETHEVHPEGFEEEGFKMGVVGIDEDFLKTFEIELVEGRNLDMKAISDTSQAFILNETAVKCLGWTDPIGKPFRWRRRSGWVVGVVKDFHMDSLHDQIRATLLFHWQHRVLAIRIRPENVPETLAFFEETWKRFVPNRPFEFQFLDEYVQWSYWSEVRQSQSYAALSLLAIFIACLGLFGLTSFTTEQRTKEIGIRKSLGASASNIVSLFSRDVLHIVVLANLIALPISFWMMRGWLDDFAYRISLDPWVFVLGSLLSAAIGFSTVCLRVLKSALKNPVEALRYE